LKPSRKTLRSLQRFESDKRSDAGAAYFFYFLLISLTLRDRKYAQWYVCNTRQKPESNKKSMANLKREKKRILMVEDHEDAWEIAAFFLDKYALFYARDFKEGLRLAQSGYFDLYILDNWLPGGNGIELCRRIREFDPHTPVLFYSACAYERDLQAAYSAGAQEYFVKPVSFAELTKAVSRLISAASKAAFEARRAEIAAVLEELAIRRMENAGRLEKAKAKRLRAEEKALRAKAQIAFLAAGGTRGDFAREWPPVLLAEVRGARTSGSAVAIEHQP
jgi:DNA-binding response OmpR family regulator